MKRRFLIPILLLAGAARGEDAPAAPAAAALSLSGFATLGVARSNSDDAQFVRYNQAKGVTTEAGTGTDSNLGLQASYQFGPQLSATLQVLTRQYTKADYDSELSWAFLRYQPRPDLSLRLGRVVMPSFMTSDYQNVGYANTMMRPPIEVYGLAALENVDGLDLSYRRSLGAYTVTAQFSGGVSHGKLFVAGGGGSIATYRAPLYGLNLTLENGPLLLRLSRVSVLMASDDFRMLNKLTERLRGAGYAQLARDMTLVGGKRIDFSAIGMTLDWRQFLLQSEYGWRRAAEPVYIPDNQAYYLMAGYRVGALLPYYAHAAVRQSGRSITVPANFPTGGALARAVDTGYLTAGRQHSDLVGLRWNFAKARALKLQIDRVRPSVKSGDLIAGPADGLKHPIIVVALALDAVF